MATTGNPQPEPLIRRRPHHTRQRSCRDRTALDSLRTAVGCTPAVASLPSAWHSGSCSRRNTCPAGNRRPARPDTAAVCSGLPASVSRSAAARLSHQRSRRCSPPDRSRDRSGHRWYRRRSARRDPRRLSSPRRRAFDTSAARHLRRARSAPGTVPRSPPRGWCECAAVHDRRRDPDTDRKCRHAAGSR